MDGEEEESLIHLFTHSFNDSSTTKLRRRLLVERAASSRKGDRHRQTSLGSLWKSALPNERAVAESSKRREEEGIANLAGAQRERGKRGSAFTLHCEGATV